MIAVYCCALYSEDFCADSIRSILPACDKVYVVLTGRPWGNTDGVFYKERWVPWPVPFDASRERILALNDPRVEIIDDYIPFPQQQCLHAANNLALPRYLASSAERPRDVIFMSTDCIFSEAGLAETLKAWNDYATPGAWAYATQQELWRTPEWGFTRNQKRSSVGLHRLSQIPIPQPRGGTPMPMLPGVVHSFGFCMSEEATLWKMLTAMAYAPVVAESPPNPDWFEKTWKAWHPVTNNRNLEISRGCEGDIPTATRYDTDLLPESIQKRLAAGEWRREWP